MKFLREYRVPLIVGLVILGAWLFLRTPASPIDSAAAFDRLFEDDRPVVVEFFGNT